MDIERCPGFLNSAQFDLVNVEVHPAMTGVERSDLFDPVFLVIIKNFKVEILKQVKVHLVAIIPDAHHARTMLIKQPNLGMQ
jgi:hypothetical protein